MSTTPTAVMKAPTSWLTRVVTMSAVRSDSSVRPLGSSSGIANWMRRFSGSINSPCAKPTMTETSNRMPSTRQKPPRVSRQARVTADRIRSRSTTSVAGTKASRVVSQNQSTRPPGIASTVSRTATAAPTPPPRRRCR
nr:hypothetical protein [Pseudolysinimonas kribbensis]